MPWNTCCELASDVTLPCSPLIPSIFIMLQLSVKIVIAVPLGAHEKFWPDDHVLAWAITQRCCLHTQTVPAYPESTEGRVERLKGEGGKERSSIQWVRSGASVYSHNSDLESVSAGPAANHGKSGFTINHDQWGGTSLLRNNWQKLLMPCLSRAWTFGVCDCLCMHTDRWHHVDLLWFLPVSSLVTMNKSTKEQYNNKLIILI